MNGIVSLILGIVFVGMVVLLCLFSCFMSTISDEYWDKLKKELERNKDERR